MEYTSATRLPRVIGGIATMICDRGSGKFQHTIRSPGTLSAADGSNWAFHDRGRPVSVQIWSLVS